MVSTYFGLPGSGKTTMLAKLAYDAAYKKKSPYSHIYGNIALTGIPNYTKIEASDLGQYMLEDCLILIDEGTLQFDNRDYKNFAKNFSEFFLLHRHYRADVAIFTQQWDGLDKRIRVVCDRVYYLHKGFLTGWYKTIVWRIPFGILIPDKHADNGDKYGEIVQGYYKPPLLSRLFTPNLKRRKYYPYFDSWERKQLPPLPAIRYADQYNHNVYSRDHLVERINSLSNIHFLKKRQLKKLLKNFEKTLDKT